MLISQATHFSSLAYGCVFDITDNYSLADFRYINIQHWTAVSCFVSS